MPTTVHEILIHCSQIIKYIDFEPLGKLSEEAQEDIKKYR